MDRWWGHTAADSCHSGSTSPKLLQPGENELVVAVSDPTDASWQARGKQVLEPKSIWYTAVSGIWQTVWLEPVPETFIAGLKITPDLDAGTVRVEIQAGAAADRLGGAHVRVYVCGGAGCGRGD